MCLAETCAIAGASSSCLQHENARRDPSTIRSTFSALQHLTTGRFLVLILRSWMQQLQSGQDLCADPHRREGDAIR